MPVIRAKYVPTTFGVLLDMVNRKVTSHMTCRLSAALPLNVSLVEVVNPLSPLTSSVLFADVVAPPTMLTTSVVASTRMPVLHISAPLHHLTRDLLLYITVK